MKIFKRVTTKLDKWFFLDQALDLLMVTVFALVIFKKVSSWILIPALIIWAILYKMIAKGREKKE